MTTAGTVPVTGAIEPAADDPAPSTETQRARAAG